jgi:excisionase family DNA binding protein
MPVKTSPLQPALTVTETALLLNIHPKTVERMARAGELRGWKCGARWRFRREDIAKYMAGGAG